MGDILSGKEDYEALGNFLGEATQLAIARHRFSKIFLRDDLEPEELERRQKYSHENSRVFIYGSYNTLEENAVQSVYEIVLSFDDLLGRLDKDTMLRVVIDRDDGDTIDDLVNNNLETVRQLFDEQGMEVSEKISYSAEKGKIGFFIKYDPSKLKDRYS